MKIKLRRGERNGNGNGVCGNSSGGGTARRESRESGYRRANGASREFSVSRGNSRTKRGEVNWCRVDCFCVADWKARIPPSGNFLNRGEEE